MADGLWARAQERVYKYRARWTVRRLAPYLCHGDRVLDIGAGDCRIDAMLKDRLGCDAVPVDVADYNKTSLPLTMFDGRHLPFADGSFDVGLLIFVLHHAEDPRAVLSEARRVCRRVIVFEDVNWNFWDRFVFRAFHRWLEYSQKIPRPEHEWPPERWSALAQELGFHQHHSGLIGRQLGPLASRHIMFVWDRNENAQSVAA